MKLAGRDEMMFSEEAGWKGEAWRCVQGQSTAHVALPPLPWFCKAEKIIKCLVLLRSSGISNCLIHLVHSVGGCKPVEKILLLTMK